MKKDIKTNILILKICFKILVAGIASIVLTLPFLFLPESYWHFAIGNIEIIPYVIIPVISILVASCVKLKVVIK